MIVNIFKSNNPSSLIFIPLIAIALWSFSIPLAFIGSYKHAMPLFELFSSFLGTMKFVALFFSLIMVLTGAFLLNFIINKQDILGKRSYLPALFYVLFMSCSPDLLTFHPILFANVFILLAINRLLDTYRKDISFSEVFDAGALLGAASLFYFPTILLFPLLGLGLIILRPFIWREWVISFIGVIVPYLFAFVYYFWIDKMNYLWIDKMFYPIINRTVDFQPGFSGYLFGSLLLLASLYSAFKIASSLHINKVKSAKALILFMWMALCSLLSLFLAPAISIENFSFLAIPGAIIMASLFLSMKKKWQADLLFVLIFGSLLYHQFINVLN